ncbi:MAG TPA: hypothetical protein DCE65_07365 [Clostridiales bacterium]|nr:hypothetical protein [Clostridiales bacterium]
MFCFSSLKRLSPLSLRLCIVSMFPILRFIRMKCTVKFGKIRNDRSRMEEKRPQLTKKRAKTAENR